MTTLSYGLFQMPPPPSGQPLPPSQKQSLCLLITLPRFQLCFLEPRRVRKEFKKLLDERLEGWKGSRRAAFSPVRNIGVLLTIPFKKGKTLKPQLYNEISILLGHQSLITQMASVEIIRWLIVR